MSFHTFELGYRLTYHEFNHINQMLSEKGSFYPDRKNTNMHKSKVLIDKGIVIKTEKIDKQNKSNSNSNSPDYYTYYLLKYRVNPRRVINDHDFVGIFNSSEVNEMLKKASGYLESVSTYLPKFTECYISRIDYCCNLQLGSSEEVERYMDLLRRCNIPKKFELKKYYDDKGGKGISRDGITLQRNKLLKITLYNKKRQMEKGKYKYPSGNNANGILRLEIQCFYRKINALQKKYHAKEIIKYLNLSDKICKDIFNYYIPKLFGKGDFFTKEEARKIINAAQYTEKEKVRMTELIDHSALHKNLNTGIQAMLNEGHTKDAIRRLMRKFDECNLSPLIIPRRWGIKYISNPLKYLSHISITS